MPTELHASSYNMWTLEVSLSYNAINMNIQRKDDTKTNQDNTRGMIFTNISGLVKHSIIGETILYDRIGLLIDWKNYFGKIRFKFFFRLTIVGKGSLAFYVRLL